MSTDPLALRDEVHLEINPASAAVAEEQLPDLISIDEAAWTPQDTNTIIIDRPQDWPTQDYVNNPPAPVDFTRPYDSI